MGAGGVPVCQWAAKGIGDQKPCWSLEIATLSPSARDHLGLKPEQELPPGSSQPLWHRSAEAGGSGAEPLRCGRSHDCPPSVRQSPSQALVAGDFSFKQSPLSLSPFPPDLPPSQGVCPRGTASSALRHAGSRVPTGCPQHCCVPQDPPGWSGTALGQASVVIQAGIQTLFYLQTLLTLPSIRLRQGRCFSPPHFGCLFGCCRVGMGGGTGHVLAPSSCPERSELLELVGSPHFSVLISLLGSLVPLVIDKGRSHNPCPGAFPGAVTLGCPIHVSDRF